MNEDGFAKPQSMSWKPGQPGDAIKGIFTGVVKQFEGQYGKSDIYDIVGIEGSWTVCDEDGKETGVTGTVVPGAPYSIWAKKVFADDIMLAKRGQQLIVKFVEMRKPKAGGKSYKYIECKLGGMDEAWLAANSLEGAFMPAGENATDPLA